jgi:leader peptidase (prepilin peptidase)/N-methyltransferase
MSPTEARWLVVAGAGLAGLVLGSFLNVVVYRAPRRLSVVSPGSFCPHCSTPVRPIDNIPVVSWFALGGRCRACRAPISPRYPVVEAGTGVMFALLAAAVGPHPAVIGLCILGAALAASLAIELDGEALPRGVAVIGAALGVAALAGAAGADGHWAHLAGAAVGAGTGLVVAATELSPLAPSTADGGRWRAATWTLVPAGTVVGWSEPVGAAVGAGVIVVGFAVELLAVAHARHGRGAPVPGARYALAGPATPAVTAAVAAIVAAVGAGTGLS